MSLDRAPLIHWSAEELRRERNRLVELIDIADYQEQRSPAWNDARAIERVPEHLRDGLLRYLDLHIRPGHFLTAVLENDLREAMGRADIGSRAGLFDLVGYLYNKAPGGAWGSKQAVKLWLSPAIPVLTLPALGEPMEGLIRPGTHPALGECHVTACPRCGGEHPLMSGTAAPGTITLETDGNTKTEHLAFYVWCERVHLVMVGVDGQELQR